jgi:ABC-type sugar transport system substrate-binding protein
MHLRRGLAALILTPLALASGCSQGDPATTSASAPGRGAIEQGVAGSEQDLTLTPAQESKIKTAAKGQRVGIVSCTMGSEYHSSVAKAAKAEAERLGFTADVFDSKTEPSTQVQGVETFLAQGVKALVICELDPNTVRNVLKQAASQGVTVVEVSGREAYKLGGISVSVQDADLGRAAGSAAREIIDAGAQDNVKVAVLDLPDIPQVVVRADNIVAELKKSKKNVTIVGRYTGPTTDAGLSSIETVLQRYPDLDGVVGINDAGAYGAVKAFEAAGRKPGNAFAIGIDAEAKAKSDITAGGILKATVDTRPADTGAMAVRAYGKLLAGDGSALGLSRTTGSF